ncbi:MAG: hypothetical protein QG657_4483 [Acidobacteriota bacterium]|nr:hypothetical protein [Acidobacteriota bacterium]
MWKDFQVNSDMQIIRLSGTMTNDKHIDDLKSLVEIVDDHYPGIDIWFKKKVVPGLKQTERTAFLIYYQGNPIGSAIIKKGKETKLCSMRIAPGHQKKGIGSLLMSLIGKEIIDNACEIYFTAPESTYFKFKSFFDNWGFRCGGEVGIHYRNFEKEILCTIDTKTLWNNVIQNIGRLFERFSRDGKPIHPEIVLSIKPEYADKIKKRKKIVEVRRKFNKKWEGASAMLYASNPSQEFFGEARISKVIEGSPTEIWKLFNSDLGVHESMFFQYCQGVETVNALVLSDVEIFVNGIQKNHIESLLNKSVIPPQSYARIIQGTNWSTTALLNYLLLA